MRLSSKSPTFGLTLALALAAPRAFAAQPDEAGKVADPAPTPPAATAPAPTEPTTTEPPKDVDPAARPKPSESAGASTAALSPGMVAPRDVEGRWSTLMKPTFVEDFHPGMPPQDGLMTGIPIDEKRNIRFALHGYFRSPLRITKAARAGGSTKPNEGDYNYRTPYLVDDDYFRSGFAYTPVSESDWTELYLSVGNEKLTGTVALQGTLYSDAARPIIERQPGISQGWLTYRFSPDFVPYFKTRVRVKAGAFWDRFGYLPKYDTYIFGRIHQMGEQVRVELERGDTTLWLTHGIGTRLEDIAANQGLTLLHYANVGASYKQTVELGGYYFETTSRDKRPLKELTDSTMSVVGVDLRVDTHYAGKLYGATSFLSADQATYQSPALEVMHSFGGRGITENYLGTQASENGTGSLWNVGFQYDISLADTYKTLTHEPSPLPWHGDVTGTLFGVYSFVQSKQQSPDPLINRDDRQSFKWGADLAYRVTDWFGISTRYDRVVLDTGDSANSFRILSPRLNFFTSFLTREVIFVQYSRYMYNERVRLRPGQVQLETIPDDHAFKIQAQMTF